MDPFRALRVRSAHDRHSAAFERSRCKTVVAQRLRGSPFDPEAQDALQRIGGYRNSQNCSEESAAHRIGAIKA